MKIFKHLIILLLLSLPLHAKTIALWPKKHLGTSMEKSLESIREPTPGKSNVLRIQNVSNPSITLYPVSLMSPMVLPYWFVREEFNILAYEHEGTGMPMVEPDWGNGDLLKYRVPRRTNREKHAAFAGRTKSNWNHKKASG